MTVLEKTINDLRKYVNYPKPLCDIASDAILCLEEYVKYRAAQESKIVRAIGNVGASNIQFANCPWCSMRIHDDESQNYCGHCGKAVKWG